MSSERVLILGASDKPERYSYKAFKLLKDHGHEPVLLSPRLEELEGHTVYKNIGDVSSIDSVTVYVNPRISSGMKEDILKLKPRRVIFNPGSENPELMSDLEKEGIEVEPACTLVLLNTGQF